VAVEETRLKIPLLFGYDVIHGYKTIFPIPLGEAASWDLEAIEESARIAAAEASSAGLHWTFAPMVDISRDPRWGRVMEGAGEDTYLGAQIAAARVRGFQGKALGDNNRLVACVKHFAAYGAAIGGRDYNSVDMSERQLLEYYLPPYEAAVRAGARTVMTSFNDYDGVPASGNKHLLTDILRDRWAFDGFVVTDYTSMNEMVHHGVAENEKAAGELAANAGVDMDMQGGIYQRFLAASVREGKVSAASIDEAVRRILQIKAELGLLDDPYRYCDPKRENATLLSQENRKAARQMAAQSMVLLQNKKQVLPLNRRQKIALIGPLSDARADLMGAWSGAGDGNACVSLPEGLRAAGFQLVGVESGCNTSDADTKGFKNALQLAKRADVVVLVLGERASMTGEAASKANLHLPGGQEALAAAIYKLGKPVVTVLMNGRPLVLSELVNHTDALLETWWSGTETGHAVADILSGAINPCGKLPMSFPRSEGQIPVYYNHKSTGRPFDPNSKWTTKYLDEENFPLFAFGFGMSYTQFTYGAPEVSKSRFTEADNLEVRVRVGNTGRLDGKEVVQLYLRDLNASVTRPVKELKAFKKLMIPAGQTREVVFILNKSDFSFLRKDLEFGSEPGWFEIFVGGDSATQNKIKVELY
jgi:beta-glucosidase